MEWRAEGVILSARPHGESSAILDVFTRDQGRYAGVLRGGAGRRMAPHVQVGNQALLAWRARLDDHLGSLTLEPGHPRAAGVLGDRLALAGLSAVCALILRALPERLPMPAVYDATQTLLDALGLEGWPLLYLHWELNLLAALGFGLDLGSCAVTGATEGLVWVSPRSGRAVSAQGGQGYEAKLLRLPPCLRTSQPPGAEDWADAMRLTGFFLEKGLCQDATARPLPEARQRLMEIVQSQLANARFE